MQNFIKVCRAGATQDAILDIVLAWEIIHQKRVS